MYPTKLQFQNIWRKDLLDLAENGFAARFPDMKWEGKMSLAIVGAGPAGKAMFARDEIGRDL